VPYFPNSDLFGTDPRFLTEVREKFSKSFNDSSSLQPDFNNANILIIGGQGFVGRWLIETLLYLKLETQTNLKISVVGRRSFASEVYKNFVNAHQGSPEILGLNLKSYSHIFFLIQTHDMPPGKLLDEQTNLEIRLINKIVDEVKNSARIMFTSSGAIYKYSNYERDSYSENDVNLDLENETALDAYSQTKFLVERYLHLRRSEVNYVAARLFTFYGPKLPTDLNFAIGNFVGDVVNKKNIEMKSSGKSIRSFMHGIDLGIVLVKLMMSTHQGPINVGSKNKKSILEVANIIANSTNSKINVNFLEDSHEIYLPNLDLLKSTIEFPDEIDFKSGVSNWISILMETSDNQNEKA
jgi:nucleoside-diphosphate-sugar epimerase